jgi:hypothetical protein
MVSTQAETAAGNSQEGARVCKQQRSLNLSFSLWRCEYLEIRGVR